MSLNIYNVFKLDPNGRALAELNTGAAWALANDAALMTIKLDSIAIEVSWDMDAAKWRIVQLHSNGMIDVELHRNYAEDDFIWKAFDGQNVKATGKFLLYGKDVNGNPHRLEKNLFAKFLPITHELVVQRHKTIVQRGPTVSVAQFYDSIKMELEQSPEIEGLVFHLEDSQLHNFGMAKVTRKQMGLPWPTALIVPPKQEHPLPQQQVVM